MVPQYINFHIFSLIVACSPYTHGTPISRSFATSSSQSWLQRLKINFALEIVFKCQRSNTNNNDADDNSVTHIQTYVHDMHTCMPSSVNICNSGESFYFPQPEDRHETSTYIDNTQECI